MANAHTAECAIKIGWTCAIEGHLHDTRNDAQQCINQAWIAYMNALSPEGLRNEARQAWDTGRHVTATTTANHL